MENRINIADLLRECPQGMELDCTMFEKPVKYKGLTEGEPYIINIETPCGGDFYLTKEGYLYDLPDSKSIIFPKGKTTWEGFVPPFKFKDGDVLFVKAKYDWVFIYKENKGEEDLYKYVATPNYSDNGKIVYDDIPLCCKESITEIRIATKEEKEKLFKTIKDHGFKWNAKTKTLEKFIDPKFKVGDKVRHKNNHNIIFTITSIEEDYYINRAGKMIFQFSDQDDYELVLVEPKFKVGDKIRNKKTNKIFTVTYINNISFYLDAIYPAIYIEEQDNWELVLNKFDINTLKPFDKVLIRDNNSARWDITFYELYDNENKSYPHRTLGGNIYKYCIPYEGNEHLCGKRDDCIDFYKTWE